MMDASNSKTYTINVYFRDRNCRPDKLQCQDLHTEVHETGVINFRLPIGKYKLADFTLVTMIRV
jgi:hypothetical protein